MRRRPLPAAAGKVDGMLYETRGDGPFRECPYRGRGEDWGRYLGNGWIAEQLWSGGQGQAATHHPSWPTRPLEAANCWDMCCLRLTARPDSYTAAVPAQAPFGIPLNDEATHAHSRNAVSPTLRQQSGLAHARRVPLGAFDRAELGSEGSGKVTCSSYSAHSSSLGF